MALTTPTPAPTIPNITGYPVIDTAIRNAIGYIATASAAAIVAWLNSKGFHLAGMTDWVLALVASILIAGSAYVWSLVAKWRTIAATVEHVLEAAQTGQVPPDVAKIASAQQQAKIIATAGTAAAQRIVPMLLVGLLCAGLALPLGGCANLLDVGQSLSTALPDQVTTLDDAINADTLAMHIAHTAIDAHRFTRPQLVQIETLNDALHSALVGLEQANARGESLSFAAFSEALKAFNAYRNQAGM